MRLVLAMLLQHEQNNLKTDVAPFTIHPHAQSCSETNQVLLQVVTEKLLQK